jgi:hypothetical protein
MSLLRSSAFSAMTRSLTLLLFLCVCLAQGQFFTKTDKAVPRLGRRMDPLMAQPAALDVPISQEIRYPFGYLKLSTLADIGKWSPANSLYEGKVVDLVARNWTVSVFQKKIRIFSFFFCGFKLTSLFK